MKPIFRKKKIILSVELWNIFFLDKNADKISSKCVCLLFREESISGPVILPQPFINYPLKWYKRQHSLATTVNSPFLKRWLPQIWIDQVLCIFIPSSPTGKLPFEYFLIINNYAKSQKKRKTVIGVPIYPLSEKDEHAIHLWVRFKKDVSFPRNMIETKELFLWHAFMKKLVCTFFT